MNDKPWKYNLPPQKHEDLLYMLVYKVLVCSLEEMGGLAKIFFKIIFFLHLLRLSLRRKNNVM